MIARDTAITAITAAWRSWQSNGRDDIESNGCHFDDKFDHSNQGPSSDTRRSAQAAAAEWPAANPRGQPAGHKANRNPSRPGCLASDNSSDLRLARPVQWQYSYYTPPLSLGRSSSIEARLFRVESTWCECACQVTRTGVLRGMSMPASFPDRAPSRQLSPAARAAARPPLAHAVTAAASEGPLGDYWKSALS